MVAPFMPDAQKLAAIREGLPATGAGIYLNTPVAGPLPAETAAAMAELEGWEVRTGRAYRERGDDLEVRVGEARAAVAAVLGAQVDEVLLTHGLGDALARAVRGVDWAPGDRLVALGDGESAAAARIAAPAFVELVRAEVPGDGEASLLDSLERAVGPVGIRTRLVVCPHVSAATGELLPIAGIAALAHRAGAALLVDGGQAAGAVRFSLDELGADLYAVGASTWLLGPEGVGALVTRGEGRPDGLPVGGAGSATAGGLASGDFYLPGVVGFGRSCGWLSMYVGLEWATARAAESCRFAVSLLGAVDGVTILTPPDRLATILTFRIAGWGAEAALDELGSRVFALASTVPNLDALRIGIGFFNSEDEVARFVDAVALLASNTPATLPPRRGLTIIGQDA